MQLNSEASLFFFFDLFGGYFFCVGKQPLCSVPAGEPGLNKCLREVKQRE
jgi:hypothetical protein